MEKGTQIIYVPDHAEGELKHRDCEAGFVMYVRGETAYCRYWSKYDPTLLRTQANSEGTPIHNLVELETRSQELVNRVIAKIEYDGGQLLEERCTIK